MASQDLADFLLGFFSQAQSIKQGKTDAFAAKRQRQAEFLTNLLQTSDEPAVREEAQRLLMETTMAELGFKPEAKSKKGPLAKFMDQMFGTEAELPSMESLMGAAGLGQATPAQLDRGPGTGTGGARSEVGGLPPPPEGVFGGPEPTAGQQAVADQFATPAEQGGIVPTPPFTITDQVQGTPIGPNEPGFFRTPNERAFDFQRQAQLNAEAAGLQTTATEQAKADVQLSTAKRIIDQVDNPLDPRFADLRDFFAANPDSRAAWLSAIGSGVDLKVPAESPTTAEERKNRMITEAYVAVKGLPKSEADNPVRFVEAQKWYNDTTGEGISDLERWLALAQSDDPNDKVLANAIRQITPDFSDNIAWTGNALQESIDQYGRFHSDIYEMWRNQGTGLNIEMPPVDQVLDFISPENNGGLINQVSQFVTQLMGRTPPQSATPVVGEIWTNPDNGQRYYVVGRTEDGYWQVQPLAPAQEAR